MGGHEVRRVDAGAEPVAVEPVPMEWQGVIVYGCPACGRNGQDQELIKNHIASEHPGWEPPADEPAQEGGES